MFTKDIKYHFDNNQIFCINKDDQTTLSIKFRLVINSIYYMVGAKEKMCQSSQSPKPGS